MKPAEYWRQSKKWSSYVFKEGVVVQSTFQYVVPSAQEHYAPYSFLVLSVANETIEVMGVPGEKFQAGDRVRLVLRRTAVISTSEPISYGLKAEKI